MQQKNHFSHLAKKIFFALAAFMAFKCQNGGLFPAQLNKQDSSYDQIKKSFHPNYA